MAEILLKVSLNTKNQNQIIKSGDKLKLEKIYRFTVYRQVIKIHLFLPTLLVSYVALNPDSALLSSEVK